jgi:hypothetical protein
MIEISLHTGRHKSQHDEHAAAEAPAEDFEVIHNAPPC